ncbi:ankyrin repeat protein [Colletotrichum camelliae]|nr:ankyrin repeat protein [Colletotrichum camelliae]
MADPLSVAASIAGLISLADVVFTRLVKYGKAVKNAEKDLKELTKDVNLLGGSLDSLSRLARALEDGSFNKNLHMDYIDDCNETLEEMKEKLGKVEADSVKGKLFWPGRSSRLKTWHEDISRHQRLINAALSADTLHALLQILSHEDQQREEILSEIRDTRSIVSRVDKDSRRSKVEAFFLKCNPQENYEMSLQLRHPRTGLWLINRLPQFQHWLSTSNSKLWLKGIPGAGKTVLAGSIIEAALGKSTCTNSIATAFFFCDYKNPVTQSPETILGILAYRLSIQNEDAYELLVQYYDGLHPKQALPRAPDISSLKVLLQKILGMYDHVYLILDGLDECGNTTEDVVDVLVGTFDEADNVSTALLSRDEDGIRDRLSDCCVSIEVAAHKHDIMEYVTAQIQERIRVGKLSAYDPELKAEIIQGLVDGAKGMFRWVSCQLDHLKDCVSDQDCRDALLALPPTLDESYARILKRVPKGKRRLVQLALQFIAYASPKLTVRQLREALSVPEKHTLLEPRQIIHLNAITKYCSSLVRESSDGQYLEFSHFSVQEFLKNISSQDPDLVGFGISESLSHRLLAVECLRFLQLRNFFRPHFDPETEQEKIDNRQVEFPFYSYAAGHWPRYARHAWDDAQVVGLAKSLFHPNKSPYFTSWAIALAGSIGSGDMKFITGILASPSFATLHLAAALSLEKICLFLLEQGADVNMKSGVGFPLQCAVHGILFMCTDWKDSGEAVIDGKIARANGYTYHGTKATRDTIRSLYRAGASLDTTSTQIFVGESLLEVAFRSAFHAIRLSVPTLLIQLGINIDERSVDLAARVLQFIDRERGEIYTASLQEFVESLDQRAEKSETTLRLCSLAWEAALSAKLDFTFNVMAIDTRVTLTTTDLEKQAIAAIHACNLQVLQKIMSDPRFEAPDIVDHNGDTLLHLALVLFCTNIEKRIEITRLLLSAGCDVRRPNNFGLQPLHVWDYKHFGNKILWNDKHDSIPFRKLMEIITKMGANLASRCTQGRNVLHYQIFSSQHFQAILDTQPIEYVKEALEAVDEDGFTPLALLLRDGALESFSILTRRLTLTPAMIASPVPILSLAVNADADEVLEFLIPLAPDLNFEPNDSPLHHLGPGATAKNTRRLKSLYPDACSFRGLHEKTPFEAYLERCLKKDAVAGVDQDVMEELSVLDSDKADASDSSKVWERFAQYAMASEREELVTPAGMSLLKLGYMESFEKQSRVTGILSMLPAFNDFQTTLDLQPISTKLICQILRQTEEKSNLREEPRISRLLGAAARSLDFELANLLLAEGYSNKRQLNEASHRANGLAAIHLLAKPGTEWMVEKLVQRGADPNLRVKDQDRDTPLEHHLRNNSVGWDAALSSALEGNIVVLAEIFATDNTKTTPCVDWERTCSIDVTQNDMSTLGHERANGLHVGASRGHTDIIDFYLGNGLIKNIEAKTDLGWTPLHFAAWGGHDAAIKVLCGHGANVNVQCKTGRSPLHFAAEMSDLASAKALVEAGGKPFADFSGCKPSFYVDASNNQSLNEWILSIEKENTDEEPSNDLVDLGATSGPVLSAICAAAIWENSVPKLELLAAKAFDFESPLRDCQAITQPAHCGKPGRTGLHLALKEPQLANIILSCLENFAMNGGKYRITLNQYEA